MWTNITYTLEPTGTRHTNSFTIYFNITSADSKLEWIRMDVYKNTTTGTYTLVSSQNISVSTNGQLQYTCTGTGQYQVSCWFKKTGYPAYEIFNTGSIAYFIILLNQAVQQIPDTAWFIITIFVSMVVMGICILYFSTGVITGYIGLTIQAIMFYMHDGFIGIGVYSNGVEVTLGFWWIWGITFILYTAGLYLYSRI
jgi:hypothetical protein